MPRIFAIGDIHGHLVVLDRLLRQLPMESEDTLVFLGDYVDRGPDSKGVLDRVVALKEERGDRLVCLLGNHEDMMLDHWRRTRGGWIDDLHMLKGMSQVMDYGAGFWLSVGGDATVRSYYPDDIDKEHIRFLCGLPIVHEQEAYSFVHAGIRPFGQTSRAEMLWGASGFFADLDMLHGRVLLDTQSTSAPRVVVGHTVFDRPMIGPDFIAIDTGCAFGGCLTAVQLPEVIFYREESVP